MENSMQFGSKHVAQLWLTVGFSLLLWLLTACSPVMAPSADSMTLADSDALGVELTQAANIVTQDQVVTMQVIVQGILSGETELSTEFSGVLWKVGDKITGFNEGWFTVANLEPIRNANNEFEFGEKCFANLPATLTILGFHEVTAGVLALVEYTTDNEPAGTSCPNGLLSFYKLPTASEIAQSESAAAAIEAEKAVVESILAGDTVDSVEVEGMTWNVGDIIAYFNFDWVTSVNLEPIADGHSTIEYGDTCWINRPATLIILGFYDSAEGMLALVEYTTDDPSGTACPTDLLFFYHLPSAKEQEEITSAILAEEDKAATMAAAVVSILAGDTEKSVEVDGKIWNVGDKISDFEGGWIKSENLEPVGEGTNKTVAGDNCLAHLPATVEILGFLEHAEVTMALVEYQTENDTSGTACPNGVIFFHMLSE